MSTHTHQWYKLSRTALWKQMPTPFDSITHKKFNSIKRQFLQRNLEKRLQEKHPKLLSCCRPTISVDPILWLPMTRAEHSRCIRWRLGWLPGGKPKPCPRHPDQKLTKKHSIVCLNMHQRLQMPETVKDPLSFLLNCLPKCYLKSPNTVIPWYIGWPNICRILSELDYLYHNKTDPTESYTHGQKPLEWLAIPFI